MLKSLSIGDSGEIGRWFSSDFLRQEDVSGNLHDRKARYPVGDSLDIGGDNGASGDGGDALWSALECQDPIKCSTGGIVSWVM
jgi:hypothetical protein